VSNNVLSFRLISLLVSLVFFLTSAISEGVVR